MRIELKNKSPLYTKAIGEAEDILGRIDLHQGEFDYFSTVCLGHMFRLDIRPMRDGELVYGQPNSWKHSDLIHLAENDGDETYIARFHYQ